MRVDTDEKGNLTRGGKVVHVCLEEYSQLLRDMCLSSIGAFASNRLNFELLLA